MNIHEILMKKAAQDELAHFYILESSLPQDEAYDQLMNFTHNFIREYYQKIEGAKQSLNHLMDHPDVYMMGNLPEYEEKKDPNYIPVEADNLIRFFEFKAVQAKRKFAVIPEGHKMTPYLANKCLKLLEEPIGSSTIFLLNPRRQKLLDTIHSRAQHLRLPVSISKHSPEEWNAFLAKTAAQTLAQFIEQNTKGDRDIAFWCNELICWEAEQLQKIESKNALFDWIKKLQEMETFHQPTATKWTLFFSFLHQHVLGRLSR
jgi:hypothetical protein